MSSFYDMIGVLVTAIWDNFILAVIQGIIEQIWLSISGLATGNIFGIPGPLIVFLMIFALGFYISLHRWGAFSG